MEQENNKNVVTIVLGVLVVILLVVCVLLATGTINFKSKKVDNKDNNSANTVTNTTDNNSDNTTTNTTTNNTTSNTATNSTNNSQSVKTTRYYQYYTSDTDGGMEYYTSREITLNTDGTAKWRFGGTNKGGEHYIGTYKEDSGKIVLNLKREMEGNAKCDDSESNFPCNTTVTLTKNSNGTVTSKEFDKSYTYKVVDKSKFVLND